MHAGKSNRILSADETSAAWDLPKGHVDEGETELQCTLRELYEETGISADDIEIDTDVQLRKSLHGESETLWWQRFHRKEAACLSGEARIRSRSK